MLTGSVEGGELGKMSLKVGKWVEKGGFRQGSPGGP